MKSTNQFVNAKPSRRTDMVGDGYEAIAVEADKMALLLRKLNGWAIVLPSMIEESKAVNPDEEFMQSIKAFKDATDNLMAEIVKGSQNIDAILKYVSKPKSLNYD